MVGHAPQHRGVGDFPAIEVQDRQDRAVADRVQKLVGVPARCQRAGLGFAVAHAAKDQQVGIVKGCSVGVRQGVAQFTAFVDRPRGFRGHVARNAARKGELLEEPLHAPNVLADLGIELAVGAL